MSSKKLIKKSLDSKPKVLVILGTTSAGKTAIGVKLASELSGEVISADSRQVYKGMDIGTGKDLKEYMVNGKKIKYHLIDVVSPKQKFDLAKYQKLALKAIEDVLKRKKLPIIIGGSGLYLQAIIDNYKLSSVKPNLFKRVELEKLSREELFQRLEKIKPEFADRLNNSDKNNSRRLIRYLEILEENKAEKNKQTPSPYDFFIIGIRCSDEVLKERINRRLDDRLEEGLVEEVKNLHKDGVRWEKLLSFGLEYKFVSQYLQEVLEYDEMVEKLKTALWRFAKRQKTWFKRWEKQGRKINWVENISEAMKLFQKFS